MKIYGLVGKSGTGKSYKAIDICREKGIETIIDDGLFISGNQILAGVSAKGQPTKVGAIKTALFKFDGPREAVSEKINEINPKSILIIGTSDKMVQQISDTLGLPEISEMIHIEEVTSAEERETARHYRRDVGVHTIPVPTFEIKKGFYGYIQSAYSSLTGKDRKEVSDDSKTVVRPTYSYLGEYKLSAAAMKELVEYSARGIRGVREIEKINMGNSNMGPKIELIAYLDYGVSIPEVGRQLQQQIASRVNMMTALNVGEVNIEVRTAR
ncbi:MAG: Asp23/Gls24 family envelope stress response protein [Firmicutes bacterium]|nr:Asp23/Gls24 family envelope stress response protein [Bacillota bacterium]